MNELADTRLELADSGLELADTSRAWRTLGSHVAAAVSWRCVPMCAVAAD